MSSPHRLDAEDLMRFMDGELTPERAAEVQAHLDTCTECQRELTVYRGLARDLQGEVDTRLPRVSVWQGVNRRLVRPVGWVLFLAGTLMWVAWAVYSWALSPEHLLVKLMEGAIFIGLALLLGSVLREHYVSWRTDPYRHIQR